MENAPGAEKRKQPACLNETDEAPKINFIPQPYNIPCVKMTGVDFTVGCQYKCVYCHFSRNQSKSSPHWIGKPVDISPIYSMKEFPENIYISPFTDAFAPQAQESAHEFISYLLPKGVNFWILTKGIVPQKTIDLFARYRSQVEIAVGLTSLDDERNRTLEPYAASAKERLDNIVALSKTGCRLGVRMDPLIPGIDDSTDRFKVFVEKIAGLKIPVIIIATYLFVPASSLKVLKRHPYLKKTMDLFTEKVQTTDGNVISTPLEQRMKKYDELNSICRLHGFTLHVCSCKDIQLKSKKVAYSLVCR